MVDHEDLLLVARNMLQRTPGQRGRLSSAQVRRSASTSYYALFHFLTEECASRVLDATDANWRRRRLLARTLSHGVLRTTLGKFRTTATVREVQDFMRTGGRLGDVYETPPFLKQMASTFLEAWDLRQQADYDFSTNFAAADAISLADSVENAIRAWGASNSVDDRRTKQAVCVLMLMRGQVRSEKF